MTKRSTVEFLDQLDRGSDLTNMIYIRRKLTSHLSSKRLISDLPKLAVFSRTKSQASQTMFTAMLKDRVDPALERWFSIQMMTAYRCQEEYRQEITTKRAITSTPPGTILKVVRNQNRIFHLVQKTTRLRTIEVKVDQLQPRAEVGLDNNFLKLQSHHLEAQEQHQTNVFRVQQEV